jgi:hypothetical protein
MHNGALTIYVSPGFDAGDDRHLPRVANSTLEPLLRRHRRTIISSETYDQPWPSMTVVRVWIGFNTRGRTLRELYDVGEDAQALIYAMERGPLPDRRPVTSSMPAMQTC